MAKILGLISLALFLVACGEVHPVDTMGSNIEVPADHEGDVDEPIK